MVCDVAEDLVEKLRKFRFRKETHNAAIISKLKLPRNSLMWFVFSCSSFDCAEPLESNSFPIHCPCHCHLCKLRTCSCYLPPPRSLPTPLREADCLGPLGMRSSFVVTFLSFSGGYHSHPNGKVQHLSPSNCTLLQFCGEGFTCFCS